MSKITKADEGLWPHPLFTRAWPLTLQMLAEMYHSVKQKCVFIGWQVDGWWVIVGCVKIYSAVIIMKLAQVFHPVTFTNTAWDKNVKKMYSPTWLNLSMLPATLVTKTCKTTFFIVGIFRCYTEVYVFKKLKHGSITIFCCNMHWCMHLHTWVDSSLCDETACMRESIIILLKTGEWVDMYNKVVFDNDRDKTSFIQAYSSIQ